MILNRTGKNFTGACGPSIDQTDNRERVERIRFFSRNLFDVIRRVATLNRHDGLIGTQQLTTNTDGRVEQSAAITAEVED